jgi:ubiquinone/menaquinone biosynthesis C-methylase UbiE
LELDIDGGKKSDQELAFLRDLYVMPDWGERFAELLDHDLDLPTEGRMLYVQAGTGGHAMAIQEVLEDDVRLVCVDESEESLELARAKAAVVHVETEFKQSPPDHLPFRDGEFKVVIGDLSLVAAGRLGPTIAEMGRVTAAGGTAVFAVNSAASFGEFFSIYWEALANTGLADQGIDFEHLITDLPTVFDADVMAEKAGLKDVIARTTSEEFEFESGEAFLNSPLITEFLLPVWLAPVPAPARESILAEIIKVIDAERHDAEFVMSVKATVLVGNKNRG